MLAEHAAVQLAKATHKNRGVLGQSPRRRPDLRQTSLIRCADSARLFVQDQPGGGLRGRGSSCRGSSGPWPGGTPRAASGRPHRVALRHAARRRTGPPPGDLRGQPGRMLMATARQVHRHVLADPPPPLPGAPCPDEAAGRRRLLAPSAPRRRRDDQASTPPLKLMTMTPSSVCRLGGIRAGAPHAWALTAGGCWRR